MNSDPDQEERKSRSQIKREFLELKKLGIELVALSEKHLQRIPLSDKTRSEIQAARTMARRALQRQYRHLASLIDQEDVPSILAALHGEKRPHTGKVTILRKAERWRDRLLSGDEDAFTEFIDQVPDCDRQQLRQLVRSATKEREHGKPPRSARLLFRALKDLLEGQD